MQKPKLTLHDNSLIEIADCCIINFDDPGLAEFDWDTSIIDTMPIVEFNGEHMGEYTTIRDMVIVGNCVMGTIVMHYYSKRHRIFETYQRIIKSLNGGEYLEPIISHRLLIEDNHKIIAIHSINIQGPRIAHDDEGFIISLKVSMGESWLSFWGPNNNGYTKDISDAGLYRYSTISQDYHNNGVDSIFVPKWDIRPLLVSTKFGDRNCLSVLNNDENRSKLNIDV